MLAVLMFIYQIDKCQPSKIRVHLGQKNKVFNSNKYLICIRLYTLYSSYYTNVVYYNSSSHQTILKVNSFGSDGRIFIPP
jgi:hypothetical protein